MDYLLLPQSHFETLCGLLDAYKADIGEDPMTPKQKASLARAIEEGLIRFFAAMEGESVVGICSVSLFFSTWQCAPSGIFEDFYILPNYRRRGIARGLTEHVFDQYRREGISALWVGASNGLKAMYTSLGFDFPLGNLLCKALNE